MTVLWPGCGKFSGSRPSCNTTVTAVSQLGLDPEKLPHPGHIRVTVLSQCGVLSSHELESSHLIQILYIYIYEKNANHMAYEGSPHICPMWHNHMVGDPHSTNSLSSCDCATYANMSETLICHMTPIYIYIGSGSTENLPKTEN